MLVGTWELDANVLKDIDIEKEIHQVGVCYSHYTFDTNQVHKDMDLQKLHTTEQCMVCYRYCLFCNERKIFFSRGKCCSAHSWKIDGCNIQVPCFGTSRCIAFEYNESVVEKSSSSTRARYICTKCFQHQGGHLQERLGRGHERMSCTQDTNHFDDTVDSLKEFRDWISLVIESGSKVEQENLLSQLMSTINIKNDQSKDSSSKAETMALPSKLLVRTIFKLKNRKSNLSKKMTPENASKLGEELAKEVLFSHSEIQKNIDQLENPNCHESYFAALPHTTRNFFEALITTLQKRKLSIVNKKRGQRRVQLKSLDTNQITKTTALLTSMILTIAFPGLKIWLTHILSSLCQKPKLFPYLQEILRLTNIIPYTKRHENRLEQSRTHQADPRERLIKGPNIWNLAIIDNIDFRASTYSRGNIYDVTRLTSHATLRMLFQFTLPASLDNLIVMGEPLFEGPSNNNLLTVYETTLNTILDFTDDLLTSYETTLNIMLENDINEFSLADVHIKIAKWVPLGCDIPEPNVVILEPGFQPNCNDHVHDSCEMYHDELSLGSDDDLYVACDQEIFARLISYKDEHKNF